MRRRSPELPLPSSWLGSLLSGSAFEGLLRLPQCIEMLAAMRKQNRIRQYQCILELTTNCENKFINAPYLHNEVWFFCLWPPRSQNTALKRMT